jgi:Zn-dependent peptidase ImmA (M78 family)
VRWRQAHQEAIIAAADAHDELDIDAFARIDVFAAMAHERLKLIFKPLAGCAALYLPSVLDSRPGALINSQHPLALQRYSGAHEFGHHRFEHGAQIDKDVELRLSGRTLPPHEMLAEAFAAWFLMPPERVDVVLETLGIERPDSPAAVYALALRFGTSYTATCVHLPSLKRAAEDDAQAWGKVALKKVKQSLTSTPPPGGWANDVWTLNERDADEPLVVRVGDRLIVDLPGRWSLEQLARGGTESDEPPADLLSAAASPTVVDLGTDMDAGPARIVLGQGTSTVAYELVVERPREGLYVPPVARAAAT